MSLTIVDWTDNSDPEFRRRMDEQLRKAKEKSVSTLPFGKYRNQPLPTVPLDYLQWVLAQVWVKQQTRSMIEQEIQRRKGYTPEAD